MAEEPIIVDIEQQRVFYGFVREVVITLLLALCFYICASSIVIFFKRQRRKDESDEEAVVHRITVILCSIAVTVSLSTVVLLPTSIISNEIRHIYPDTYYIKWLDTSLIKTLWNLIFLGSNLCLFLLLPFAFFFTEAEGLPGTKKGVLSRAYEAILVLIMIGVVILGIIWVADALTVHIKTLSFYFVDIKGLFSYVPFMYSCMSMFGVFITSVCTPVGFSHLFTLLGTVIVQPELHVDVQQELEKLSMEESSIRRRLSTNINISSITTNRSNRTLHDISLERTRLERHLHSSIWERHVVFPLCFLILLSLTCISLLLVSVNVFSLIFTTEHLPKGAQEHIFHLGESSASYLGPIGALVEVILIIYMTAASLVGFFNAPLMCHFKPVPHNTSLIKVILNAIILLILSSAMPVVVQVLGITKYNLFGHFAGISFLHSFWLLLIYNITFFVLTCSILFTRATQSVLREVTYLLRTRITSLHVFKSSLRNKKQKIN